jgi:hypothetical protein
MHGFPDCAENLAPTPLKWISPEKSHFSEWFQAFDRPGLLRGLVALEFAAGRFAPGCCRKGMARDFAIG